MSVLSLLPDDKRKEYRKESLASVYSSNSRLNLLNKRKRVGLLDMSGKDKLVTQRVLSAKAHRVKQLQNQLADAHYHLQELSNENRILRAMQKKQEIALQRYEGSNAELPIVLSSHSEEIRIQQAKYKQLKKQFQEVQQKLKEKDMQFQQLKDEHNHLLELSRDRNLLEREKLQQSLTDLTSKVQQQNEQISMLQRRLVLEQKNFKHQLQNEINKHKDTRHDLDLAITNADKLSTIIEMKEKMLSTAAGRNMSVRSPPKPTPSLAPRPVTKSKVNDTNSRDRDRDKDRNDEKGDRARSGDPLTKICETSRNLSSVLSYDDEVSSAAEPRSRYTRSRASSVSKQSSSSRKNSKAADEMIELAKTVQDGMADLSILDDYAETAISPDEMQKEIDKMKQDLMKKITSDTDDKNDYNMDRPLSRKASLIRRQSTEESIEEVIEGNEIVPSERPKSRGRRNSSVSFCDTTLEESTTTVSINDYRNGDEMAVAKPKRVSSGVDRKIGGKPIETYCKEIMHDIEKSTKVIDKHMRQFSHSQFESDKLAAQLASVDRMNDFVNSAGDLPAETLRELNNNFKMLTDSAMSELPAPRKRSITGKRNSRMDSKSVLDDGALSNQDLLNDLLGRK